jgi:hypothetical protein
MNLFGVYCIPLLAPARKKPVVVTEERFILALNDKNNLNASPWWYFSPARLLNARSFARVKKGL